jgi:hypothetical protein
MTVWGFVLGVAVLTGCDADRLGDDCFWVRQGADARLRAVAPLSLPAVAFAARSGDLERRRRAERILWPWLHLFCRRDAD